MIITRRLHAAAKDPHLRGAPLSVYVHLIMTTDPGRHTPIKVREIATALTLTESSAHSALHKLIDRSYVERGPSDGRTNTYKVVWTRQ